MTSTKITAAFAFALLAGSSACAFGSDDQFTINGILTSTASAEGDCRTILTPDQRQYLPLNWPADQAWVTGRHVAVVAERQEVDSATCSAPWIGIRIISAEITS